MSLVKNSITTFQHDVIEEFSEETSLLRLLQAPLPGFKLNLARDGRLPIGCSTTDETHGLPDSAAD